VTIAAPDRPCLNRVILRYHGTLSGAFSVTNLPSGGRLSYGTGSDSEIRLTIPAPGTVLLLR